MDVVASLKRESRELWKDGKGRSLIVIATGWGMLVGMRMVYPVVLPYLRTTFDLSLTAAGLLLTILWLGGAIGQLPGGVLADRYSERTLMAISTAVVAIALVFVVTASTPVVLFAVTGLVGLSLSLYPIARITILSQFYPDRIGSALGVTMATGDLGQTVLPLVAGVLTVAIAWQAGLAFVIPLFVLVSVVLWVTLPAPSRKASADRPSFEGFRDTIVELRRPNLVLMTVILFLFIFIWQSFSGFYPTYLIEVKGLSSTAASSLFGLFFAFGIVVKPLAGSAYDRIGIRKSLIVVLVGPVVGLGLLPTVHGFWSLVVVTALVSSMLGTGAVTQSYLSDSFSREIRGTGLGVVRTTASTLGAGGPLLFGVLADRGYFDEGYVLLAVIMGAVILLTYRMPDQSAVR